MHLLYGTTNPSKLSHMQHMLHGLDLTITSPSEALEVDESGSDPLENATIKAMAYYKRYGVPTFSCDSDLYIEGLAPENQPGVHVRRVGGTYMDDDAFIAYYAQLARRLGGTVSAKFKNGICLVLDEEHIYHYDGDDIADHFILTSAIHPRRRKGFPMDSISMDPHTGEYIVAMEWGFHADDARITAGFRSFFRRSLSLEHAQRSVALHR